MSVTVKRGMKSFSTLINIKVQLNDVTLDRLAPGESITFELPDQKKRLKIKAFFSKKEGELSDGDVIEIVRNSRIRLYKLLTHILLILSILSGPFITLVEYPALIFAFQICSVLLSIYVYYFVPDFLIEKTSSTSTIQETEVV